MTVSIRKGDFSPKSIEIVPVREYNRPWGKGGESMTAVFIGHGECYGLTKESSPKLGVNCFRDNMQEAA